MITWWTLGDRTREILDGLRAPTWRVAPAKSSAYVMGQGVDILDEAGEIARTVMILKTGRYTLDQLWALPDERVGVTEPVPAEAADFIRKLMDQLGAIKYTLREDGDDVLMTDLAGMVSDLAQMISQLAHLIGVEHYGVPDSSIWPVERWVPHDER